MGNCKSGDQTKQECIKVAKIASVKAVETIDGKYDITIKTNLNEHILFTVYDVKELQYKLKQDYNQDYSAYDKDINSLVNNVDNEKVGKALRKFLNTARGQNVNPQRKSQAYQKERLSRKRLTQSERQSEFFDESYNTPKIGSIDYFNDVEDKSSTCSHETPTEKEGNRKYDYIMQESEEVRKLIEQPLREEIEEKDKELCLLKEQQEDDKLKIQAQELKFNKQKEQLEITVNIMANQQQKFNEEKEELIQKYAEQLKVLQLDQDQMESSEQNHTQKMENEYLNLNNEIQNIRNKNQEQKEEYGEMLLQKETSHNNEKEKFTSIVIDKDKLIQQLEQQKLEIHQQNEKLKESLQEQKRKDLNVKQGFTEEIDSLNNMIDQKAHKEIKLNLELLNLQKENDKLKKEKSQKISKISKKDSLKNAPGKDETETIVYLEKEKDDLQSQLLDKNRQIESLENAFKLLMKKDEQINYLQKESSEKENGYQQLE